MTNFRRCAPHRAQLMQRAFSGGIALFTGYDLTDGEARIGEARIGNRGDAPARGSTIALSGSAVTVTLGEPVGSTRSETNKNELIWSPSSSAYDLAGNAAATTKVTGANVRQF